jgi:hypothetical protein
LRERKKAHQSELNKFDNVFPVNCKQINKQKERLNDKKSIYQEVSLSLSQKRNADLSSFWAFC